MGCRTMDRIRASYRGVGSRLRVGAVGLGGDEGEYLTSLFVTLETLCTMQPKGNYL